MNMKRIFALAFAVLMVLALALFLMAVAEHYNIDPAWFLIVWYLSDNIPTRNA